MKTQTDGAQVADENPFRAQAATEARAPKKPSPLDSVITGKRVRPIFCVVYGPPGVGKTTFASKAPSPIFLAVERGVDQVGASRFPQPKTFEELYNQIRTLDEEPHNYKTIVIDTLDALESLIWARVCSEYKVDSIEKPAYGNGFARARTIWRGLLSKLTEMSERFNVVLIGHAAIKTFSDPSLSAPYDTWKIKIHDKSADVIREMVDTILFACLDVEIFKEKDKDRKGRALSSGDRIMHSQPSSGYECKNRFDLGDPMPLEWAALEQGVKAFYDR